MKEIKIPFIVFSTKKDAHMLIGKVVFGIIKAEDSLDAKCSVIEIIFH